jgi:hypothetical protein
MAAKERIFSGARAELSINGDPVGFATNCTGGEDIDLVPIIVLNNVQVREFVPVGYTVTFSSSKVRLIGPGSGRGGNLEGSYKRNNIFPKTYADPRSHLMSLLMSGGTFDGLTVTILDTVAVGGLNQIFMRLEQAQMQSRNWSFGPRDIVGVDVNFVGIRMFDQEDAV